MWIRTNPNPKHKHVPDCVVRAICLAYDEDWYRVYDSLCDVGREDCNMPSADAVWGHYLQMRGASPFLLPEACPRCITIRAFCEMYPVGRYIIGTGGHAVCIINGNYFDSWDSGDESPSFFWRIN